MREAAPAFQFYPKDFVGDSRVMRMSAECVGAYLLLLCACWQDQALPDDDEELALIARLSKRSWAKHSDRIRGCFQPHPTEPGKLVHKRLDEERTKQADRRELSAKRAAAAGGRRSTGKPSAPSEQDGDAAGTSAKQAASKPRANREQVASKTATNLSSPLEMETGVSGTSLHPRSSTLAHSPPEYDHRTSAQPRELVVSESVRDGPGSGPGSGLRSVAGITGPLVAASVRRAMA